ncbi:RHS repeat-associated core domain-containing protein [Pseudomonas fluorescens]|uniref:RHS repeat-associated core domain-containing protein n=1 Tax=Pseudomonas fluorescens TaxID=294 RepID=A0A5E7ASF1_PSEFL|nr:RHS repeat-associated core domain-containing protein [Pseudomonas fluorescens]VVN78381.1 hypothetical protein PS723_00890 [Pseudomonas fluorescens]
MVHSIADDHANPSQRRTVLLAIDSKNSVLAEVIAGQTNHIAYSAYGHQSAQQEVITRLGFNGEWREMHTSWYLLGNGYRAYNPRLMRFHSPDKLSPFGAGGLNAYMYCGGEPVMNSDPTGHTFFSWKNVFQILDFFSLSNNSSGPLRNPLPIEAASGSGGLWGAAATLASRAPGPGGVSSTPIGKNPPLHGTSGPTSNYRPSRPALTGVGALVDSVGFSGSTSRTYPTFLSSGNTHTQPRTQPRSSFDEPRVLYDGPVPKSPILVTERLLGKAPTYDPHNPTSYLTSAQMERRRDRANLPRQLAEEIANERRTAQQRDYIRDEIVARDRNRLAALQNSAI